MFLGCQRRQATTLFDLSESAQFRTRQTFSIIARQISRMGDYLITALLILMSGVSVNAKAQKTTSPPLFPIEQNGKEGYIDQFGKVVIQPKFDEAWKFSEGLAAVLIDDRWGYIDITGRIVIQPQYFEAGNFKEGLAAVGAFSTSVQTNGQAGNYGYIDKTGEFVIKPAYGVAFEFADGLARIQTRDYKNGYIDKTGNVVFWDDRLTEDFSNGLALFKTNSNLPDSKTGYLAKTGKPAISPRFDAGQKFSEGLACVSLNGKSGFIDTKGNTVIAFRFEHCGEFSEGLASVLIDGSWGYIDRSGEIVIKPKFAEVEPFADGVAIVRAFDEEKPVKVKNRYKSGLNIASPKPGKFGAISRDGEMILPARFVQLGSFANGLAWVNLDEEYVVHGKPKRWGYINKAGEIVWTTLSRRALRDNSTPSMNFNVRKKHDELTNGVVFNPLKTGPVQTGPCADVYRNAYLTA
jgi:WG containing repeat